MGHKSVARNQGRKKHCHSHDSPQVCGRVGDTDVMPCRRDQRTFTKYRQTTNTNCIHPESIHTSLLSLCRSFSLHAVQSSYQRKSFSESLRNRDGYNFRALAGMRTIAGFSVVLIARNWSKFYLGIGSRCTGWPGNGCFHGAFVRENHHRLHSSSWTGIIAIATVGYARR